MQEITSEEELLKVDRRGHVRVSAERREALLDEFERSGVSAMQFAEHIGVKYQTFATWRYHRDRKRRLVEGESKVLPLAAPRESTDRVQWVEAVVERSDGDRQGSQAGKARLAVSLPGGARMEIDDAGQVVLAAELLRMLEIKGRVQC